MYLALTVARKVPRGFTVSNAVTLLLLFACLRVLFFMMLSCCVWCVVALVWLVGWLVGWLAGWLAGWLVGR